jgi:hypothetical protein
LRQVFPVAFHGGERNEREEFFLTLELGLSNDPPLSGFVPSPNTQPSPPGALPDSKTGAVTNGPVQIYHLGIWFNTPEDATAAGCKGVVPTPFTSNHRAGPQILNTGTFPNNAGPLLQLQ